MKCWFSLHYSFTPTCLPVNTPVVTSGRFALCDGRDTNQLILPRICPGGPGERIKLQVEHTLEVSLCKDTLTANTT